ncbi:MAG: hypothetical protein CXT67_04705 [Methanobacteriota archaeon]|nr:MAG: hypothetical protein CXT67_04705 [Euryarchaeota archaeon]HIG20334.1 DUF3754 domain-containing protein [Candidatus Poseidoniales archaeon]
MVQGVSSQHFIPISRAEIKRLLLAEAGENSDDLSEISNLLEGLWHHRMHSTQESLKQLYSDFDPDSTDEITEIFDSTTFVNQFSKALTDGNWLEITDKEMQAALDGEDIFPISLDVRLDEFKLLKTFKLGEKTIKNVRDPSLFAKLILRKEPTQVDVEVYERIIQVMQFRERAWFENNKTLGNYPGTEAKGLHLRLFKTIPKLDLEVIFPNTSPNMRRIDQVKILAPLIGGLATLGMKFGPLLFGFGSGETSLALIGGIISALATYILKSWTKYMKTKEAYLSQVSKDLYFKGQANNQAVINMVIDFSEEQEVKEALLAYSFLLLDSEQQYTMNSLDERIEKWLAEHGVEVNFEVDDALNKLLELGLLNREGGKNDSEPLGSLEKISVLEPNKTLSRLDEIWDGIFQYEN